MTTRLSPPTWSIRAMRGDLALPTVLGGHRARRQERGRRDDGRQPGRLAGELREDPRAAWSGEARGRHLPPRRAGPDRRLARDRGVGVRRGRSAVLRGALLPGAPGARAYRPRPKTGVLAGAQRLVLTQEGGNAMSKEEIERYETVIIGGGQAGL